jgi:hypothetical protein
MKNVLTKYGIIHTMEYYSTTLKKCGTDRCYNMCKPWKHYSKWKKQDANDYILTDFT